MVEDGMVSGSRFQSAPGGVVPGLGGVGSAHVNVHRKVQAAHTS